MNKKLIVLCGAVAIIVFTIIVSYVGFKIFADKENQIITRIEVALKDKGEGIKLDQPFPYNDKEAEDLIPYEFEITNKGSIDANYKIVITDIKDGSEENLLSRNQLRYELSLNGSVIAKEDMSKIKDNILDSRSVPKYKTNKYELKIWVPQSAEDSDWMSKYYHYKVDIKPLTEEIK